MTTNLSRYQSATSTDSQEVSLQEILSEIQNGTYASQITAIRNAKTKAEASKLKKQLPAMTFSGVFKKRKAGTCTQKSGLMVLDIDGTKDENTNWSTLRDEISQEPEVYSAFISPSGNGLKVVVHISDWETENDFKAIFLGAEKWLQHNWNKQLDKSGKDSSRLCFMSYDPDIYIAPEGKKVNQIKPITPEPSNQICSKTSSSEISNKTHEVFKWQDLSYEQQEEVRKEALQILNNLANWQKKTTGKSYIVEYRHYESGGCKLLSVNSVKSHLKPSPPLL